MTPSPSVAIVDDDQGSLDLARDALTEACTEVEIQLYDCGSAILDAMLAAQPEPRVVLLDLNMPKVHGFDVLRGIKTGRWKDVPVVILTSSCADTDREKAFALGAAAFVTKAMRFDHFMDDLGEICDRYVHPKDGPASAPTA